MYLIVIAWMYVVLMMSLAEATNANGTILGALMTFVLYGAGPMTLAVYLMGAPARNKAIKAREAQARAEHLASQQQSNSAAQAPSVQPDGGGHAASGAKTIAVDTSVAPVRKEL